LDRGLREAPVFYGLYTCLIVLSAVIVLIPGLPLFPLMWLSQVVNAILLPAILLLMLLLVNDVSIMRTYRNHRLSNVIAGALGIMVTLATVALLVAGGGPA